MVPGKRTRMGKEGNEGRKAMALPASTSNSLLASAEHVECLALNTNGTLDTRNRMNRFAVCSHGLDGIRRDRFTFTCIPSNLYPCNKPIMRMEGAINPCPDAKNFKNVLHTLIPTRNPPVPRQ